VKPLDILAVSVDGQLVIGHLSDGHVVYGYDPSQPRHPSGSDKGGEWAGGDLYHGTTQQAYQQILKEGLLPSSKLGKRAKGGTAYARLSEMGLNSFDVGGRRASVYLARKKSDATTFAHYARSALRWKPGALSAGGPVKGDGLILLRIRIPKDQLRNLRPDEQWSESGKKGDAWRFKGRIPPEWIKEGVKLKAKYEEVEDEVFAVVIVEDLLDDTREYAQKRTLYIRRDVLNAEAIRAWAKAQGFNTVLTAGEMHVTQAYSRALVDWTGMDTAMPKLIAVGGERLVTHLGDKGAIILKFSHPDLTRRWEQLREMGCSWDRPSYHPHVTLTYANPQGLDPAAIAPYTGPIELGPERFEELDLDWADDVKENAADEPGSEGEHKGVWRTIRNSRVFIRDGEELDAALERHQAKMDAQLEADAQTLAAMPQSKVDNLDWPDIPGGRSAYNLFEARKMLPKPSDKLKRVTDNNSFSLWSDFDYIANVGGRHFGITKQEDPDADDDEDQFVFAYEPLDRWRGKLRITSTADKAELINELKTAKFADEEGVWRTINGRRVFIPEGALYHGSREDIIDSVLKDGLIPNASIPNKRMREAVWMTRSFETAMTFAAKRSGPSRRGVIFEVRLPEGSSLVDGGLTGWGGAVFHKGRIDPKYITRYARMDASADNLFDYKLSDWTEVGKRDNETQQVFYTGYMEGGFYAEHAEDDAPPVVNYAQVRRTFDRLESEGVEQLSEAVRAIRDAIVSKVRRGDDLNTLIRDLELPRRADLTDAFETLLRRAWDAGSTDAQREVREARFVAAYAFDPAQPRAPGGSELGGQWIDTGKDLKARGFYLEEHHKRWLESGEVDLRDVSPGDLIPWEYDAHGGLKPDEPRVQRFIREWKSGIRFPALEAFELPGGKLKIMDGHHRLEAWKQLNPSKPLPVLVSRRQQYSTYAKTAFTPKAAISWLKSQAITISGILGDKLLGDAKLELLRGLRTGMATELIISGLLAVFIPYLGDVDLIEDDEPLQPHRLETIVRTNLTTAYNHGRLTQYVSKEMIPFLNGVRYSAVMDLRTTPICRFLDGKVFLPTDPDLEAMIPPNHFNCRSIIVPIVAGSPVNKDDFITPAEIGRAKEMIGTRFLSAEGAWANYAWDEAAHPRGKTTDESNDGSFAPANDAPVPLTREARAAMTPEEYEEYRRKARERAARRRAKKRGEILDDKSKTAYQMIEELKEKHGHFNEFSLGDSLGREVLENKEVPSHMVMVHEMPKVEEMKSVNIRPGLRMFFSEDTRHAASHTITNLYMEEQLGRLPPELSAATSSIYMAKGIHKSESRYMNAVGKKIEIVATGGGRDGGVMVVYRAEPARPSTIRHEMAHNLAVSLYGGAHPPSSSRWGQLWNEWKAGKGPEPVREYGKTNIAEAHATSFERMFESGVHRSPWIDAAHEDLADARKKFKVGEKT
jgi:SPP1 gp7 family putative phage head morphogenesis protein